MFMNCTIRIRLLPTTTLITLHTFPALFSIQNLNLFLELDLISKDDFPRAACTCAAIIYYLYPPTGHFEHAKICISAWALTKCSSIRSFVHWQLVLNAHLLLEIFAPPRGPSIEGIISYDNGSPPFFPLHGISSALINFN